MHPLVPSESSLEVEATRAQGCWTAVEWTGVASLDRMRGMEEAGAGVRWGFERVLKAVDDQWATVRRIQKVAAQKASRKSRKRER